MWENTASSEVDRNEITIRVNYTFLLPAVKQIEIRVVNAQSPKSVTD